jgi:hypothetical protein
MEERRDGELPFTEAVESRLQQSWRRSESCQSKAVNRGRKFNKPPDRSLAQNAEESGDAQSTVESDTSRCLFVQKNHVGFNGFSQENCSPDWRFSMPESMTSGLVLQISMLAGSRPNSELPAERPRGATRHHSLRHGYSQKKLWEDVDLADQDEVAER